MIQFLLEIWEEAKKRFQHNPLEIEWIGDPKDGVQIFWDEPEYHIVRWKGGRSIGGVRTFPDLGEARKVARQMLGD